MTGCEVTPSTVYGLWSTRDRVIRYIGQTTIGLPEMRLSRHRSDARRGEKRSPVSRWIAGEMAAGFSVEMRILCHYGDGSVSEGEYIALYRALGAPLLNVRAASGLVTHREIGAPVSLETRRKLAVASKGRRKSPETIAKLMRAAYGIQLAKAKESASRRSAYNPGPLS